MDELTLEIGFQLIPMVDEKQGGQMLNRVRALRRHLATELGFIVPPVHITDNLRLKPREYVVSLRGVEIARWQTEQNCLLAVNCGSKGAGAAGCGDEGAGVWRAGAVDSAWAGGAGAGGGLFGGGSDDGDWNASWRADSEACS